MALPSLQELNSSYIKSRDSAASRTVDYNVPAITAATVLLPLEALQPSADAVRAPVESDARKAGGKKYGINNLLADLLFLAAVFLVFFSIATSGFHNGAPKVIFGYSYFTVLTSSMQDEIPKRSFILVKHVDPNDLAIGDNITFMRDSHTSITHKIVDIYENYGGGNERGFQTKGTNNEHEDKDIVLASNVVGKVVYSIPSVGAFILYLESNLHLVYIVFGLFMLISFCIRGIFSKSGRVNAGGYRR